MSLPLAVAARLFPLLWLFVAACKLWETEASVWMPVGARRLFCLVFIPGHAAAACIRPLFVIVRYYGVFRGRGPSAGGLVVSVGAWRQGQSGWKQLRRS